MTQPEHTPGPWSAEEHEKAGNLGYKEFYIDADGGYLICDEICNPHDARLISALPEMFDFIVKIAYEEFDSPRGKQAAKILAKIKGEIHG